MSYFEAYGEKRQLLGPQGELLARIADFLERKSHQVPERLEALCEIIQTKVRSVDLRESLSSLVAQFRARGLPRASVLPDTDPEWDLLVEEIKLYGQRETIESYTEFFFSMENLDGFPKQ